MEITSILLLCLILFSFSALIQLSRGKQSRKLKNLQPPGPPGWPILGNFFDLGAAPHQTLHKLKPKYGPVLGLKLGSVNTVVIQSAMAASEFFKKHDHDFCDRKCSTVLTAHNYYQGTIAFGRYGKHWRMRRRICSTELLMNRQTNKVARLRRKCIEDMIRYIEEDAAAAQERGEEGKVNLARLLFLMSFNLVGNLVLSMDLLNSGSKDGSKNLF
ncbi:iridoid oxidase-like [Gossypium raimondii]|uniref:iridoid oxidase-like n=1 Tax=Gossypium raimondii TaxID=29730 RepID=UPI00063AE81E|nr:iridoid oxidase-like [Gossypium raimondii]